MASSQIPLWLDCDPGHDDAFAILLAAYHPRFNLLGISAVFGNAPLTNTAYNAASLLTAMGKHDSVPLYVGESKALERPALHADEIHGKSGLDGTELLPEPLCKPSDTHGVEAMAAALKAQPPNTAWLVATGSLTNVGALFRRYPELASHVKGVSLMGGSIGENFSGAPMGRVDGKPRIGNYTPWAEFNILVDPEAASELFGNEALKGKIVMTPLDLSHQVLATEDVRNLLLYGNHGPKVGEGNSTLRRMLVELLYFFAKTYADVFDITAGPPLHDPLAVAAVLAGTEDEIPFFHWDEERSTGPKHDERFEVTVVTEGSFEEAKDGGMQTGRTIAKKLPQGEPGVRIPRGVDEAAFWREIEKCMERADEVNKAAGRL